MIWSMVMSAGKFSEKMKRYSHVLVLGQTGFTNNSLDPDQMPQNGASDQVYIVCSSSSNFYTQHIMKSYLYSFDPLKTHFYIVNLGFTGIYIIFLISAQKELPHNLCFEQKYEKTSKILSENFQILVV